MKNGIFAGILLAVGCVTAWAADNGTLLVKKDRVNLRAKPAISAERVGSVNAGARLQVRSSTNNWFEVAIPEGMDTWVHKDFIKDGVVASPKLNVRAGPSENYSTVGMLHQGDTVTTRGESGDWIKIAAPAKCSVWISAALVEIEKAPVAEKTAAEVMVTKAPAEETKLPPPATSNAATETATLPAVESTPPAAPGAKQAALFTSEGVAIPPALAEYSLVPLKGQGQLVEGQGQLRLVDLKFGQPSRYRLCRDAGNHYEIICYVLGNSAQLESLLNQQVTIRGRQYFIEGLPEMVLIPEQITILPAASAKP